MDSIGWGNVSSKQPVAEQTSEAPLGLDTTSVRLRQEDVVLQYEDESRTLGATANGLDLPSHNSSYSTNRPEPAQPHRSRAAPLSLDDPTSDGSSLIDSFPHRPPTPTRDFEGYNRYLSQLSPEEYHNMFAIAVLPQPGSESGSDVDSNEGRSHIVDLDQHTPSAVLYVDDEISLGSTGRLIPDNNAYGQASGSNDVVVIPARQATVLRLLSLTEFLPWRFKMQHSGLDRERCFVSFR